MEYALFAAVLGVGLVAATSALAAGLSFSFRAQAEHLTGDNEVTLGGDITPPVAPPVTPPSAGDEEEVAPPSPDPDPPVAPPAPTVQVSVSGANHNNQHWRATITVTIPGEVSYDTVISFGITPSSGITSIGSCTVVGNSCSATTGNLARNTIMSVTYTVTAIGAAAVADPAPGATANGFVSKTDA